MNGSLLNKEINQETHQTLELINQAKRFDKQTGEVIFH